MSVNAPLPPAPYSVGVFPFYTQEKTPVCLRILEKKSRFDSKGSSIKNASTGVKLFYVNGKSWKLRGRREMFDNTGTPLMRLVKRRLRWHTNFSGRGAVSDDRLFTVKSSFIDGSGLSISYVNTTTGKPEQLQLDGDFSDRDAVITLHGVPVARISRHFLNEEGEVVLDSQAYFLTVAAGVDIALLAALCVCLDEKTHATGNVRMNRLGAWWAALGRIWITPEGNRGAWSRVRRSDIAELRKGRKAIVVLNDIINNGVKLSVVETREDAIMICRCNI